MATSPFNTVYAHAPLQQTQNAIYRSQMNTSYVASTPTPPPPPPPTSNYYYESTPHHSQVLLPGSSQAPSHNGISPQSPAWPGLGDKRMQSLGFGNGGSGHAGIIPFSNGFHNSPSNASLPMSMHTDEKIKSSHTSQSMGLASSISSSQDLPAALLTNQSRPGCRILATTKRAAQNRAAQRAFRQRKDRYIKDLEVKAKELESSKRRLEQAEKEKEEMKSVIAALKAELAKLKGETEDDKSNRGDTNSNSSSGINSPFTPNGSSEDDLNGLGEDPWMRKHKSPFYNERTSPAYQSPPSHPRPSINSHADAARPPSTAATTNSSTSPTNTSNTSTTTTSPTSPNNHFELNRNDYRSYPDSPTNDSRRPYSSCLNNTQSRSAVSEDDPAERVVMDDLCELLRTRSPPDVHTSMFWPSRSPASVVAGNGSNAVVG